MIILRWLLIFILVVFLLLLGLLVFLGSESGTRLAWNSAHKYFPEMIAGGKLEGRLADKISLTDLKIITADIDITISEFEFAWHPTKLLSRNLEIDLAKIEGLVVRCRRWWSLARVDPHWRGGPRPTLQSPPWPRSRSAPAARACRARSRSRPRAATDAAGSRTACAPARSSAA